MHTYGSNSPISFACQTSLYLVLLSLSERGTQNHRYLRCKAAIAVRSYTSLSFCAVQLVNGSVKILLGNENSHGDEIVDNVNGVADSIDRMGCQRSLTVFAHLMFCIGAQRDPSRKLP